MSALLSAVPTPDDLGGFVVSVAGVQLRLRPEADGWTYARDGLAGTLALPARAPDSLRLMARLGPGEAVLRLDPPLLLLPDETQDLWVSWPLDLSVQLLSTEGLRTEIDAFRPLFRRTVFGPVDAGRVLPAHTSGALAAPDAAEPAGVAALRLRVSNRTAAVVQLRRALVDERALALWAHHDRLAAGDVIVALRGEGMAEVHSTPGQIPPGWTAVGEPPRAPTAALAWLLDATRRSVEYPT